MERSQTQKKTVPESISNEIALRIARGQLHPNEHLVESAIAAEFQTSRAPVREALLMLEKDRLVTRVPHRGFVVRKFTAEEFHQLYDATFRLEEIGMVKAIQHATPEGIRELEDIISRQKEAADRWDVVAYYDLNEQFHRTIMDMAGNAFLTEMHQSLRRSSRALSILNMSQGNNIRQSYEEHCQQLEALKRRDPEAAIRAIRLQETRSLKTLDVYYGR